MAYTCLEPPPLTFRMPTRLWCDIEPTGLNDTTPRQHFGLILWPAATPLRSTGGCQAARLCDVSCGEVVRPRVQTALWRIGRLGHLLAVIDFQSQTLGAL